MGEDTEKKTGESTPKESSPKEAAAAPAAVESKETDAAATEAEKKEAEKENNDAVATKTDKKDAVTEDKKDEAKVDKKDDKEDDKKDDKKEDKKEDKEEKKGSNSKSNKGTVRKNKSFKRIRGILSGRSRRKSKKKEKEADSTAAAASASATSPASTAAATAEDDGESTIYGVNVEERSVVSRKSTSTGGTGELLGKSASEKAAIEGHEAFFASPEFKKPYMLKVVLLLMDPETRRFELLQLEFDSMKALVSDVLAQIPVSVTEEVLRKQTYKGICGKEGLEYTADKLLATFCDGNDVLVAVPKGVESKECARLAKPILSDEKVLAMLLSSGIDAKGWKEESKAKATPAKETAASPAKEDKSEEKPAAVAESPKPSSSPLNAASFAVFFLLLAAILLQVFHLYISAPIKPGHVVSPGIWLSKCGLFSFFPGCENSYVEVDKEGLVTLYDHEKEIVWQIQGEACEEGDEECVPGMSVSEDSELTVGGKKISWVTMYKEGSMSPWPFSEQPKVKVWKK